MLHHGSKMFIIMDSDTQLVDYIFMNVCVNKKNRNK